MAERTCPDCRRTLPLESFPRNRNTKSGVGTYCKSCHSIRGRQSRDRHGGARRYHLRRRYGIEPEDFDALVAKQGGLCAICREVEPTHLDHDHLEGKVRGALCVACNNGLGLFRDRPEVLARASRYVEGVA